MAEEVLSDLGMAQGLHIFFAAVDAAAGLVEADYVDGFGGVAGRVFASEVRVEAFGADGDEDVDCGEVSTVSLRGLTYVDRSEAGDGGGDVDVDSRRTSE